MRKERIKRKTSKIQNSVKFAGKIKQSAKPRTTYNFDFYLKSSTQPVRLFFKVT